MKTEKITRWWDENGQYVIELIKSIPLMVAFGLIIWFMFFIAY